MERIAGVNEERVEQLQQMKRVSPEGTDPLDALERDVVAYYQDGNSWKPTALKTNDDVLVDDVSMRVLGPALGRQNFFAVSWGQGEVFRDVDVRRIGDRAPADEDEEPMPVVPGLLEAFPERSLEDLRADAFRQIDQHSDLLIKGGFFYQDIRFSATLEAQIRYNAMLVLADTLTYPLDINSLDDRDMVSLQSADETRQFVGAALAHVKGVVDSGTREKERVRAMDDYEELETFTDSRRVPEA